MATDASVANRNPEGPTRRKGERFSVLVPVQVKWQAANGAALQQEGQAKVVSATGGLLQMQTFPPLGVEIEVVNSLTKEGARARVIDLRRSRDGHVLGLAVKLLDASETFWGITFQLRVTSAQLVKLENAIRSGGADARVLREFRDAVDYIRKTAWVVQEWQERQLVQRDAQTVLSLLTAERIRRAAQLSNDLASDLEGNELSEETPGIRDLTQAVERLRKCLVGERLSPKAK